MRPGQATNERVALRERLASTGITEGFPDDTFRPTNSLTRQAAAAFLMRLNHIPL